jgi:POT family proton-dependent oligopeptide transporter
MPVTHFWLIHAGFAAVAGVVFILYKAIVAPRLMSDAPPEDSAARA